PSESITNRVHFSVLRACPSARRHSSPKPVATRMLTARVANTVRSRIRRTGPPLRLIGREAPPIKPRATDPRPGAAREPRLARELGDLALAYQRNVKPAGPALPGTNDPALSVVLTGRRDPSRAPAL